MSRPAVVSRNAEPRLFNAALDNFAVETGKTREQLASELGLNIDAADYQSASKLASAMQEFVSVARRQGRIVNVAPTLAALSGRISSGWNDCPPTVNRSAAPGRIP